MTKRILITGIVWDTDEHESELDLPSEVTIQAAELEPYGDRDEADAIVELLTDTYDTCVRGCTYDYI